MLMMILVLFSIVGKVNIFKLAKTVVIYDIIYS